MIRVRCAAAIAALVLSGAAAHAETGLVSSGPSWSGTGVQSYARHGWSVAPAGDFNGDGYGDLVVGSPVLTTLTTLAGSVMVRYGSPTGLDRDIYQEVRDDESGTELGVCVTWLGDVNNDGLDDVAGGAPMYKGAYARQGKIRIFMGHRNYYIGAGVTITGATPRAEFGRALCGGGDVDGDGINDVVVGAPRYEGPDGARGALFLYAGGRPFLTSAKWTYSSARADALGSSLAGCGDVNGDGYNDVVAGAPEYDDGTGIVGAVYVFFGDPDGLGGATPLPIVGSVSGAGFGRDVAMGDFNGDGFSDVAVTAPDFVDPSSPTVGRVFVYYSIDAGAAFDAPVTLAGGDDSFGASVEASGDLNQDGIGDLVVGTSRQTERDPADAAYVYAGSLDGIPETPTQIVSIRRGGGPYAYFRMSAQVTCAGDVNGDGIADLAIGNGDDDSSARGEVVVHHGLGVRGGELVARPSAAPVVAGRESRIGSALAWAGDVDGDGWDDLLVGDYHDDAGGVDAGAARVYRGGPDGWQSEPAWIARGTGTGEWFGYAVAGVGDVDGDGYSDIAVGSPHASVRTGDEGAVFVYRGSPSGPSGAPSFVGRGGTRGSGFGFAVAGAGDVNGDGYGDVLAGASLQGRARVYYGNPYSLSDSVRWDAQPAGTGSWFGYAVASAGDVDADGFSDLVVGAPHYSNGEENEGALFVYRGGRDGPAATPSSIIELDRAGAMLGVFVACAGDVDGDFFSDVIAGAGGSAAVMGALGNAFLFPGGDTGVSPTPVWSVRGEAVGGAPGFAVCGLGDVDGDGYSDVAVGDPLCDARVPDGGRVRVYTGRATGLYPTPRWEFHGDAAGDRFGSVVAPAGDVTGDARADLLVGSPGSATSRLTLFAMPTAATGRVYSRQLTAQGEGNIALRGYSGAADHVRLRTRTTLPPGISRVHLEYQVSTAWEDWPPEAAASAATLTLPPGERRAGAVVVLEAGAAPSAPVTAARWRVRVGTESPWAPASQWIMHHANFTSEPCVRIGFAPDVAPPPDPGPDDRAPRIPFRVERVYPTPFNPDVTVRYALDVTGRIDVSVFDVRGAHVATLHAGRTAAGRHTVRWDGRDARGVSVGSGIYFVRVRMGGRSAGEKLVLVR